MDVINDLPVLILGYNRFDKFTRCIKTLREQGIKKIYVSIDGPKDDYDFQVQKRIIEFCLSKKLELDIKINKLKRNYGCRKGPVKGISWFFNENKYGVILEDDVIVSKKCIQLFHKLLEKHDLNKDIFSISSFNEFTNKEIESIYNISVFRSWGWASWAERWKMHLDFSEQIKDLSIWQLYNLFPKEIRLIETAEIIKACQLNLLDAWDYEFNFTHIINNKKSLTIGGINSYVYGFDQFATHTINNNVGIDFDMFCERRINESEILELEIKKHNQTKSKCGFSNAPNKNIFNLLKDKIKALFYSFVFYLRIIKRNFYKNFN